ncbi:MAG TPA: NAD(P)H-dependent glycerol-3-phosphate dehydrogenase, partial [Dehalococcoidia bacterium]|nr:NAD(P)H-dependent glycerol-3-phosphate dehydrogenase [Dehalococcoidia bacterium]
MSPQAFRRAAVVGTTAWGTTLAILLARNGLDVTLLARTEAEATALEAAREHERRLPGERFPSALVVTADVRSLTRAELACFVVPAQTMADAVRAVGAHVAPDATVLSASKGIEIESCRRMSEILATELPGRAVAALSGPNLSREVAAGLPGTTVIASVDGPLEALRGAFHRPTFRVYTSSDLVGVELGGALKNIVAIAAGMVDALGYGDNAKAAVMTRGLAEMTRLGVAAGADPLTFQGLAGVGDLIATSYSRLSRNRRLGERLAQGASFRDVLEESGETAEGAATAPAALRLA